MSISEINERLQNLNDLCEKTRISLINKELLINSSFKEGYDCIKQCACSDIEEDYEFIKITIQIL